VEGAFVQGLGMFTIEELRYSQSGAPWTTGPGAYKIPGFADIPVEFYVHLLRSAPNEKAVYSSKVRKSRHKRSSDSTRRITCASLTSRISKRRNQLLFLPYLQTVNFLNVALFCVTFFFFKWTEILTFIVLFLIELS